MNPSATLHSPSDQIPETVRSDTIVADALGTDPSTLRRGAADDLRTLRAHPALAISAWKALRLARDADQRLADLVAQFGRGEAVLGLQRGLAPCCDRATVVRRVVASMVQTMVSCKEGGAV